MPRCVCKRDVESSTFKALDTKVLGAPRTVVKTYEGIREQAGQTCNTCNYGEG